MSKTKKSNDKPRAPRTRQPVAHVRPTPANESTPVDGNDEVQNSDEVIHYGKTTKKFIVAHPIAEKEPNDLTGDD